MGIRNQLYMAVNFFKWRKQGFKFVDDEKKIARFIFCGKTKTKNSEHPNDLKQNYWLL